MPTWGEILGEIAESTEANSGRPDFDGIRRKYLAALSAYTGRNTVVYASNWMNPTLSGPGTSILLQDMQGLMEVFKDLPGPELDLILHSPGGDPTAAASLVSYMRQKYEDVRVFVPLAAMSAATMWSLAADRIVMGKHSQLGPIDPQLQMPQGFVPAGAIRRQFENAKNECSENPGALSAWLPTLQQYFPGLLEICADVESLGKRLVCEWLTNYMFKDRADGPELAKAAADFFSNDQLHGSHSRGINRDQLRGLELVIEDLEDDAQLQDAVLSVHHAVMHTFERTATLKIMENHLGRAYVNSLPMQPQQLQFQLPPMQIPGTS